jgi:hypothetical protein
VSDSRQLTVSHVRQEGASAHGDVVGRDKYETHVHPVPLGPLDQLLQKLQSEIAKNERVRHTIEALAHFQRQRSLDGVVGLKDKLDVSGRSTEYLDALEKKELFAKLLEKWSLYESAQEIFAYLLAKAEHEFNLIIYPQIATLQPFEVNQLVTDRIIVPAIGECGSSVFTLNHSVAMGMVYWLAEQCFVRWHT